MLCAAGIWALTRLLGPTWPCWQRPRCHSLQDMHKGHARRPHAPTFSLPPHPSSHLFAHPASSHRDAPSQVQSARGADAPWARSRGHQHALCNAPGFFLLGAVLLVQEFSISSARTPKASEALLQQPHSNHCCGSCPSIPMPALPGRYGGQLCWSWVSSSS